MCPFFFRDLLPVAMGHAASCVTTTKKFSLVYLRPCGRCENEPVIKAAAFIKVAAVCVTRRGQERDALVFYRPVLKSLPNTLMLPPQSASSIGLMCIQECGMFPFSIAVMNMHRAELGECRVSHNSLCDEFFSSVVNAKQN